MWSPRSFDEALTDKQAALADVITGEGTSIMAELALGNEHVARELLDADASVVEKLLHRIEDVKETLARRKDAAAKEAFEEVRKAEQMFLDALAEKGMRFEGGKIVGADEEDKVKKSKTIDKSKKGGYNKPKRPSYIRIDPKEYAVLQSQVMSQQSEYIAKNEPLPNSFCAYTANFFYIYDNWEHGKFGVRKQILITDANQEVLKSIERELNGEAKFIRSASDFDRRFKILERESRRYQRSGTPNSRELADSGNGELSTEKQGGIGERNSRGSSSDQRDGGVKKSRKTTAKPPETSHLTPMQKQTVANYTRAKVYTKAEALAVVEDMAHFLDENYGFDGGMGEASGFVSLTKAVKDAQSLFSFLVKIHPNKKTNRNKKCVVKNKFPISENNIRKPIDKPLEKVYNDANETKSLPKEEAPLRRIELWQPNPRNPLPLWSPLTPIARRSARPSRRL